MFFQMVNVTLSTKLSTIYNWCMFLCVFFPPSISSKNSTVSAVTIAWNSLLQTSFTKFIKVSAKINSLNDSFYLLRLSLSCVL